MPTQITSDFFNPSSVSFDSLTGAACTKTGTSISPTISPFSMNDATNVPVSSNTAPRPWSTSVVRSMAPAMRRGSGPQRKIVRPEGPIRRISSVTNPVGTFHARNNTNGSAGPGWPTR